MKKVIFSAHFYDFTQKASSQTNQLDFEKTENTSFSGQFFHFGAKRPSGFYQIFRKLEYLLWNVFARGKLSQKTLGSWKKKTRFLGNFISLAPIPFFQNFQVTLTLNVKRWSNIKVIKKTLRFREKEKNKFLTHFFSNFSVGGWYDTWHQVYLQRKHFLKNCTKINFFIAILSLGRKRLQEIFLIFRFTTLFCKSKVFPKSSRI